MDEEPTPDVQEDESADGATTEESTDEEQTSEDE